MRFSSAESTMEFLRSLRRRLAGLPIIMWLRPAVPRRTRPLPVILKRFFALLFVFIFGMTLSYSDRSGALADHTVGAPRGARKILPEH